MDKETLEDENLIKGLISEILDGGMMRQAGSLWGAHGLGLLSLARLPFERPQSRRGVHARTN